MIQAAVCGLNHITIAVGDLDRSVSFYRDVLGCVVRARWDSGAYLEAGPLWLCLSHDPAVHLSPKRDYSHVAFDVERADFAALAERIRGVARIWKNNRSEGESLYFLDPDGHRLEIHVGSLAGRIAHYRGKPPPGWVERPG